MAAPFVLLAAGTALQVMGRYSANLSQAQAEMQNAEYYRKQSLFAKQATDRQIQIATQEYEARKGAQISAAAKGGADVGTGSIVNIIANTAYQQAEEIIAIKRKGALDEELARLRGFQSQDQANTLSSFGYNATQAGGTVLTNFGEYYARRETPSAPTKPAKGNT